MSKYKTKGRKAKLAKSKKKASPAPRWIDIRKFGLGRARFRSVKRFKSKHWRRGKKLKV